MDRIEQLRQFAAEEPDDPFNLYALALELLKTNRAEASRLFERLVQHHRNYLPTYYPYAQLLIETGEPAKAEEIFKLGIQTAKGQNDQKTLREIEAAYHDWEYERQ
jgi:predicted Zn-dependent protease